MTLWVNGSVLLSNTQIETDREQEIEIEINGNALVLVRPCQIGFQIRDPQHLVRLVTKQ